MSKYINELWTTSPNKLIDSTDRVINKSIEVNKFISKMNINNLEDFNNFMSHLANDITEVTSYHSMCSFIQFVCENKDIRRASYTSDMKLTNYLSKLNLNDDIYHKITECYKKAKNYDISDIDHKFLKKMIRTYKINGIELSLNDRKKLLCINQEMIKIELSIYQFINRAPNSIEFTKKELHGLPNSILKSLKVINDNPIKYSIHVTDANYPKFMRYIDSSNVRKKIEQHYHNKFKSCSENIIKLLILRKNRANLLGHDNYSNMKSKNYMAKHSDNIKTFLNELLYKLDTRFCKEMETISNIQNSDSSIINSWDIDYYIIRWKKLYGLNEDTVRKYFPAHHVINEIFSIYQDLFNLKFVKNNNHNPWNSSVILYNVYDNNEIIGFLYLDIFKRTNKMSQTRCFNLQPITIYPYNTNKYQPCVVALVSSVVSNRNTLLSHSEVISLFHEFGQATFQILGKSKYCAFSGSNAEFDFVQIPPLILDNMCWDPIILKRLSCNYENGKQLSDNIIKKMVKIRNINIGVHYKKVILSSIYDQLIHSSTDFLTICEKFLKIKDDKKRLNNIQTILLNLHEQLHESILKSIEHDQIYVKFNCNNMFPDNFMSLLIGNDAKFYGLLWSKIYAIDIYNEKFTDLSNLSIVGMEFRKNILETGGHIDAFEIIKNYIGRKPTINGFLKFYRLESNYEELSSFYDVHNNLSHDKSDSEDFDEYSNKFSEVHDSEINGFEEMSVNKYNIHSKLNLNEHSYITENTEAINRHKGIFIKY